MAEERNKIEEITSEEEKQEAGLEKKNQIEVEEVRKSINNKITIPLNSIKVKTKSKKSTSSKQENDSESEMNPDKKEIIAEKEEKKAKILMKSPRNKPRSSAFGEELESISKPLAVQKSPNKSISMGSKRK